MNKQEIMNRACFFLKLDGHTNLSNCNLPETKQTGSIENPTVKINCMRMKNILILFILSVSFFYSCKDKNIDDVYITPEDMPAASYLNDNADKFSLWVELLEYTDLYNTMNVDANYTCFVPNNDAMKAFLASKSVSSVRDLDLNFAKTLVKYHTIAGSKITQSEFPIGDISDTTATGDKLSIDIQEGGINAIYVNGEARITDVDIEVTNAIIHILDKVLTPITESVWDKVNVDGFSVFKAAVQATGFDAVLSNKANKFTVFSVPDSVYSRTNTNITDLSSLVSALGAGPDYTVPTNLLYKYVAYHIVAQQMSYAEMSDFSDSNRSKNINTLAENELFNLKDVSGALLINYNSVSGSGIDFININKKCKNGIIHTVNNIMPVVTPQLATIQWEFTDYTEIANLFSAVYRVTTLSSASTKIIADGDVTCYTWQSIPEDNKSSVVKYFVSETGSSARSTAKNKDYLLLDKIGIYGWIQMQTPAVLKGSYTMKLAYYSPNATSKSGKVLFILDGKILGSEISTIGYSSTTATYVNSTIISTVTFDVTKSHTLRILAGDKASVYLDYIAFEPIN
jgi:uncharacterized surface protein with fasciclin (FAS1) repeats